MHVHLMEMFGPIKSPFENYLESDIWKRREAKVLARDPVCQLCHERESVYVRHPKVRFCIDISDCPNSELIAVCKQCLSAVDEFNEQWEQRLRDEQEAGE